MATTTQPACLKFAGLLGHQYAVIEPSDHWTAVNGWRVAGECGTLGGAKELAAEREGAEVYERQGNQWVKVAT